MSHVGIFGKTGSGKTVRAKEWIKERKKEGHQVFVLETFNELYSKELDLEENIKDILGVKRTIPFKLNPLIPPKGVEQKKWNEVVAEIFCITYECTKFTASVLTSVLDKAVKEATNRGEVPTLIHAAEEMTKRKNSPDSNIFVDSAASKVLWVLNRKTGKEQVFQKITCGNQTIDMEKIVQGEWDQHFDMSNIPFDDTIFFSHLFLAHLYFYLSQNQIQLKKPITVIAEEADKVFSRQMEDFYNPPRKAVLEEIFEQAGNYGVSCVLISQIPNRIHGKIRRTLTATLEMKWEKGIRTCTETKKTS